MTNKSESRRKDREHLQRLMSYLVKTCFSICKGQQSKLIGINAYVDLLSLLGMLWFGFILFC